MNHQLKKRLIDGELLLGTMLSLNSPEVAELLAEVGFNWLFIDAEHTPFSIQDIQRIMQAADPYVPCVVRLPTAGEVTIKKALDIGAAGIIAPMVNTPEEAAQVVRWSKYSPDGIRGIGVARAHRYGLKFQEYIKTANDDIAVIVQAEHIQAVENIESIAQVPGLDAIMVGPYDLSASLGKLGRVDDPEVVGAIDWITQVCQSAGIRLGIFGMSAEAVEPYIKRGYTFIVAGIDTVMLSQAAGSLLTRLRG